MNKYGIELNQLSDQEKRDLLARMTNPIPKARTAPLSFAQERIWQLDRLEPGSSTFNITAAYRLSGQIKANLLEQSLNQMGQRHAILRTSFATVDGRPVQVIAPQLALKLNRQDWQGLAKGELEAQMQEQIRKEHHLSFDLGRGPLLRATLAHLGEEEYLLILTTHRIIFDGQCWPILTSELATFYEALAHNTLPGLPKLALQYGDYAVWQREWLSEEAAASQLRYWQKKLDGRVRLLHLPTDHPRTGGQSRSGLQQFSLPELLGQRIKRFSQQEGVSQFVVLLTAFQLLLYHHTKQEEFLVFTSVAGRNRPELKELFGLFANVLPLRAEVEGNLHVRELLRQVRDTVADAFAHQDVPFEQVLETLRVERDQKYTPVFQVMFVFWPEPIQPVVWSGLTIKPVDIDTKTAEFDLYLHLNNTEPEMSGTLRYKADLFEAESIAEWVTEFQVLLAELVSQPDQPISSLWGNPVQAEQGVVSGAVPLLPSQWSYIQTPEQWVNMVEVIELAQPLNPLWLEQAVRHILTQHDALRTHFSQEGGQWRQNIAIMVGTIPFSYNNLSHLPIAERTEAMQTTLAAVQSSLGPLKERLIQVNYFDLGLEQPSYLVLSIHHIIADNGSLPILLEDLYQAYRQLSQEQPVNLPAKTTSVKSWSEQLVKYGRSEAFHRQLKREMTLVQSKKIGALPIDYPEGQSRNTLGSTAKVKSTLSVEETEVLLKEFPRFYKTPLLNSLLTALAQALTRWSSEESLTLEMVDMGRYLDLPGVQNVDLSRTVGCLFIPSILVLERPEDNDPIQMVQAVSEQLHRWPMSGLTLGLARQAGYAGEEVSENIPTAQLRLNYLGQTSLPDLPGWSPQTSTAVEDFVSNRRYPELNRNPLLLNCAAVITQGQLIMSWEYSENIHQRAAIEQVANEVTEALQMMVDRHRQICEEKGDVVSEKIFVGPRTPAEEVLANIWAKVFGLERISVNDNFYELGGDSLLALRIISQAKQAGLNFTPQQFFQNQTVAELAKVRSNTSPEIEQTSMTGEIPLISTQEWLLKGGTNYKRGEWSIVNAFAVPLALLPNPSILEQVTQYIWRYHDQLRARFVQDNTRWRQFIDDPNKTIIPFYYIDLSELNPEAYETAIKTVADDLQIHLDLAVGPLFRITIFYLNERLPLRLVVIIHHLVADGFSTSILLEDFITAYGQVLRGEPIQLLPKTMSVEQWVKALRNYAQSSEMRREMKEYWFKLPWEQLLLLPLDYPENKERCVMESGDAVEVSLSVEETRALQKELPRLYNAGVLEALIMAALQAITQWADQHYLLINILGTGRDVLPEASKADVSRTVCWTNIIRLLLLERVKDEQPEDAFLAVLEQLRRIPNKGFGFDLLNRYGDEEIKQEMKRIHPDGRDSLQIIYHGDVDGQMSDDNFFQIVSKPGPIPPDPQARDVRSFLTLRGEISDNRFMARWEYNRNILKQTSVEKIANDFTETLRLLIAQIGK